MRMVDLSGVSAALVGGVNTNTRIVLQDSRLNGFTGLVGGAQQLQLHSTELRGGAVTLGAAGGGARVAKCILEDCAANTIGSGTVALEDCLLRNGSVQGTSPAPVTIARSYVSGTSLGGNVTTSAPVPLPQLGKVDVAPVLVPVGSIVTLTSDLPANLSGVWIFGLSPYAVNRVIETQDQRIYIDPSSLVFLPGAYRGFTQLPLLIPNVPPFRGFRLFFQHIVFPDAGMQAPAFSAPPARRIILT
jgi:hypothetical protein